MRKEIIALKVDPRILWYQGLAMEDSEVHTVCSLGTFREMRKRKNSLGRGNGLKMAPRVPGTGYGELGGTQELKIYHF